MSKNQPQTFPQSNISQTSFPNQFHQPTAIPPQELTELKNQKGGIDERKEIREINKRQKFGYTD